MKALSFLTSLLLLASISFGQTGYISGNYTYTGSNTYSDAGWNGNITIASGANITINKLQVHGGTVTLQAGATLTVNELKNTFSGLLTIPANSVVNINDDAVFNKPNVIAGKLSTKDVELSSGTTISGTLNSDDIKLLGNETISGKIVCKDIEVHNTGSTLTGQILCEDFTIHGVIGLTMGNCALIKASGTLYNKAANGPIAGIGQIVCATETGSNKLTNSNTIYINVTSGNYGNLGAAVRNTATTAPCNQSTPVTLIEWLAENDSKTNVVNLKWTTSTELNNSYFKIEASTDGRAWDSVARVNTQALNGNSNSNLQYKLAYKNPLVPISIKASFGFLAILLIVGLVAGTLKNKRIALCVAVCLSMGAIACSKNNDAVQPLEAKYKYFKLTQIDIDGTATSYKIVKI